MENKETITLDEAKQQLNKIMNCMKKGQRESFMKFAIQELMTMTVDDDESDEGSYMADDTMEDPVAILTAIRNEIRNKIPVDAILPSETLLKPEKGENADCYPNITKNLDRFLYDDVELHNLVKEGKIQRWYCQDCGSKNIESLKLVSHSMSHDELYEIFNDLLPTIKGKTVLDVGSRLGAVLYGAYVYTDAKRIIGVEMNKEFCDLQNEIIRKFNMEKRVEIVNKRIEDAPEEVKSADIVVLNNVFEFYIPESEQIAIWKFLRTNIKKGARIVSRPPLEIALKFFENDIVVSEWVEKMNETVPTGSNIAYYSVL